jgi:hypothetical protein
MYRAKRENWLEHVLKHESACCTIKRTWMELINPKSITALSGKYYTLGFCWFLLEESSLRYSAENAELIDLNWFCALQM